jgi:hypothetical protein
MQCLNSNCYLISFLLLFATNCNESGGSQYQKETGIFNRYLKTTRLAIKKDSTYLFICTPGSACVGCNQHLFNLFSTAKNGNTFLLTSSRENYSNSSVLKDRIYFDSTGKLDRINLPIRNASVIFYGQGKISGIVSVNPDAPDSIDYKITQWLKIHKEFQNALTP